MLERMNAILYAIIMTFGGIVIVIFRTIKIKLITKWILVSISVFILIGAIALFIISVIAPDIIQIEETKEGYIKLDQQKYIDPLQEYTIMFPDTWVIDERWSTVNWAVIRDRGWDAQLIIRRISSTPHENSLEAAEKFDKLEGKFIGEDVAMTVQMMIDGRVAQVLEFTAKYDLTKGYTSEYSYGKAYFVLNKSSSSLNEYQIIFEAFADDKEEAKSVFNDNSLNIDYMLRNFKFID